MGHVSQHLRELLARQVNDRGLVVWFDPEKHYEEFVRALSLPNVAVLCHEGSFYELRHRAEPFLQGVEPPRLIVYVPRARIEAGHALIELEAAGAVLQPGDSSLLRNTRLAVLARAALRDVVGDQAATAIEKQADANKLSLVELDRLAEKGAGLATGVISVIFGTSHPTEVALAFLGSEMHDTEVVNKGAGEELAALLTSAFGVEWPKVELPTEARVRFTRHLLATDLLMGLHGTGPMILESVKVAPTEATRAACAQLAARWRGARGAERESYVEAASKIAGELNLRQATFGWEAAGVETFLEIEQALLRTAELALLEDPRDEVITLARTRQSSFWPEQRPELQARWALVATAGELLREANRIERGLKVLPTSFEAVFDAYTAPEQPWCLLDSYHRHLERRWHSFDFEIGREHEGLERLVVRGRQRYTEVGDSLSEAFLKRAVAAKFRIPGLPRQVDTFLQAVQPSLAAGKTAFIAVDALRFEMARELAQSLAGEATVTLRGCLGAVPTITGVGMAALLPGAETSLDVIPANDGRLAARISGVLLRERKDRIKFLREHVGVEVHEAKLEDLLPTPKKQTREGIRAAGLVFITSQEIDALGEGDQTLLARRLMGDVLHDLRRACRVLSDLGIETIVLAADHGFLFGEELGSDRKIDPPGGQTFALSRRVWIGHGGAESQAYLRAAAMDFQIGGGWELAAPWNFAGFKSPGGANAYFHGGLSPQEWVIPVLTFIPTKKVPIPVGRDAIQWRLTAGSKQISTRFFSIQVAGETAELLQASAPKVRLEVRVDKSCVSVPVSSSYEFEEATGDVHLRFCADDPRAIEPNTVTLMITHPPTQKIASVHLLDAVSGAELAQLKSIEVNISL